MDLRDTLKAWEKAFAARHGRKPGRSDIKAEPAIAAKYREYQQGPRSPQATPQAIRQCLGPTPQKNGQIIGLFDSPVRASPKPVSPGRTPRSAKRVIDTITTPIKRRRLESPAATPAFLSRSPEEFKPRKGLARSLSSILQDLRDSEDARHDAEWDVLREIEEEGEGEGEAEGAEKEPADIENEQQEMPLGPDTLDDDDESSPGQDQPSRTWKKKGLKRQTKQVKMKPRPRPADTTTTETTDTTTTTTKTTTSKKKVNTLAHTNFCKLKIKGKDPKPKGRFRR